RRPRPGRRGCGRQAAGADDHRHRGGRRGHHLAADEVAPGSAHSGREARTIEPMFDEPRHGPLLGIDPGLSRCGYGAIRRDGNALRAIACGVIRTPPGDDLPVRLAELHRELEALVAELRPSVVVVERVLFQVNARTAIAVGQASGVALTIAARAGIPVVHYSPNEVKLAVAGYGGADKAQGAAMGTRRRPRSSSPRPPP